MSMLPSLAFRILQFLSFSPIFRVTCDKNFGEITRNSEILRFSFLSINLGVYILHICTFQWVWGSPLKQSIKEEFHVFKILALRDVEKQINCEEFTERIDKHRNEIEPLDPKDKDTIKEALFYKMNSIIDSKNRTFNKFLAYLAVVAFLVPIYTPYLTKLEQAFDQKGIFLFLMLLALFYIVIGILNLMLFFHEFIKVKSYPRYRYQDVKNSSDRITDLLQMVYYERYLTEFEWIREVTLIKNIEKYIKGVVIMSLALVTFHNISLYFEENEALTNSNSGTETKVYVLNLANSPNKLYTGQKDLLDHLESGLIEDKISEIVLIRSGKDHEENYNRILSLIQSLNVNNIEITIAMNYTNIDKNELTILLKKGVNK